jgi:platelet-activating factor acetylhydrolase IB subunit beta/gamma
MQTASAYRRHEQVLSRLPGSTEAIIIGDSLVQGWPPDGRVFNMGVGIDRTQQVLWRLQNERLQRLRPKTVVLLIGTNNLSAGDKGCAIAAGISAIVAQVKSLWAPERVLVFGIPPRFDDRGKERNGERLAANELVRRMPGIRYIDVEERMLCCEPYLADRLHVNKRGYDVLSEALREALHKEAGKPPS